MSADALTHGIRITPFQLAQRFIGMREIPGREHDSMILAMLRLDDEWPDADEVPWCSAFVNFTAWLLRLPRSKSLRARSWLRVGRAIALDDARPGFDLVVLSRGQDPPGPEVIDAPGHVGWYAGHDADRIWLLGGNQGDTVSSAAFPRRRILSVRRLDP